MKETFVRQRRSLIWNCGCIAGVGLLLVLAPGLQAVQRPAKAQLSGIPISLNLEHAFEKVEAGKPAVFHVFLKDSQGAVVKALRDETVHVHYKDQQFNLVVPAGRESASFTIMPGSSGFDKVELSAPDLAPGSALVVPSAKMVLPKEPVVAPHTSPAEADKAKIGDIITRQREKLLSSVSKLRLSSASSKRAADRTPASAGEAAGAHMEASPEPALALLIQPQPVHPGPGSQTWKADVAVALVGKNDQLVPAGRDLPVHLSAQIGQVTPSDVTIAKNESATFGRPISIASTRPGQDVLTALSPLPKIQQPIAYTQPDPAGFRLEASPASVLNDGKTSVRITVMLVTADQELANSSARATEVVLGSSLGSINPARITLPPGECCAEATLASAQNGIARVSADSPGLKQSEIPVAFLFPWPVVLMAGVGGAVGALAKTPKHFFSRKWWKALASGLFFGLVFGIVFFLAAFFGAIGSLPKMDLPIQIKNIPTSNELGALVVGFVGGFYGRSLWDKPLRPIGKKKTTAAGA